MTEQTLNSLYPRLEADERFRLVLEAVAREDVDEIGHLSATCPSYTYVSTEIDYWLRLRGASAIALAATNLLLRARLDLARPGVVHELIGEMDAARAELSSSEEDGAMLEPSSDLPEILEAEQRSQIEATYTESLSALLGVCEGVERFCGELGVEPRKLLAFGPHCLPVWDSMLGLRGAGAPDPIMAATVHKYLAGSWSHAIREGSDLG